MVIKITERKIKKLLNRSLSLIEDQKIKVHLEYTYQINGSCVQLPTPGEGPLKVSYYKKEMVDGHKERSLHKIDYPQILDLLSMQYKDFDVDSLDRVFLGSNPIGLQIELVEKGKASPRLKAFPDKR